MADETKVRVKLDTRQAKTELRGFVRESAAAAGRVAGGVKRAIGRGLGVVGLGAGIGTGLAAVRGATESGFGDVIGEALGGVGAELAETIFGDLDEDSRAKRAAREETIQAFGAIAGRTGAIPPGARNFFEQVKTLRLEEERGREMFERDERFRGAGVGDLVKRIMEGIGELITQAVRDLADLLNPFK